MSASIQRKPRHIVAQAQASPGTIEQLFYEVDKASRDDTLHLSGHHTHPKR